jgi:hypothetical protein
MVQPDLSLFQRVKSIKDFNRDAEEDLLQKSLINAQIQKAQNDAVIANQDPASIREWQAFNSMPPQDQQRYLQMKRADQVMNLGGSMAVRSPMGGIMEQYTVTPKISETPEFEAMVSGAQTAAKLKAEDITNAQTGLGNANEQSRQILDVIGGIEQSPGLSAVVGMPNPLKGGFGLFNVPSSPAADFQAKLDQLGGKQFLQAFESLKGGGQITQIEGEKATNAIARMQTSQSETEFRKALSEFKDIVIRANQRAQQKAQQDPMAAWQNALTQRQSEIGTNPYSTNQPTRPTPMPNQATDLKSAPMINIIHPKTGEALRIPESDFLEARKEGFMRAP